jgi:hypothetical protein
MTIHRVIEGAGFGQRLLIGQGMGFETAAAKAAAEGKRAIAAVNRCATQNQVQHRLFPQLVKPCPFKTNREPT